MQTTETQSVGRLTLDSPKSILSLEDHTLPLVARHTVSGSATSRLRLVYQSSHNTVSRLQDVCPLTSRAGAVDVRDGYKDSPTPQSAPHRALFCTSTVGCMRERHKNKDMKPNEGSTSYTVVTHAACRPEALPAGGVSVTVTLSVTVCQ